MSLGACAGSLRVWESPSSLCWVLGLWESMRVSLGPVLGARGSRVSLVPVLEVWGSGVSGAYAGSLRSSWCLCKESGGPYGDVLGVWGPSVMLTLCPSGVPFSAVEFGNMQKINKPEAECEDPEEPSAPDSCSQYVSGKPCPGATAGEPSPRCPAPPCASPVSRLPARRVRAAAEPGGLRGLPGPGPPRALCAGLHAGPLSVHAGRRLRLQHPGRVLPPVLPLRRAPRELEDCHALP